MIVHLHKCMDLYTVRSILFPLTMDQHKVVRRGDSWTYILHVKVVGGIHRHDKKQLINVITLQGSFICRNAVGKITVKACDDDSCMVETANFTMLPDGRMKVVACFTSLVENKKHLVTVQVQYNGGVVQHSLPVYVGMCMCKVLVFNHERLRFCSFRHI